MAGFRRSLEALVAPMPDIKEGVLEGTFMNGLKQDIRTKVQLLYPQGLGQIKDMTQIIEDRSNLKARRDNPAQKAIKLF